MQAAVGVAIWLLIIATMVGGTAAQRLTPECVTDEDRVHIRMLLLAAIDDAWKDQVKHLFMSWLKDPHGQPARASAGIQASVVAYQRARVDALRWTPNSCEIIK